MFFTIHRQLVEVLLAFIGSMIFLFLPLYVASADTLISASTFRAHNAAEFTTTSIDTSMFSNLVLSFDFDATTLDFGPPQDTFSYGFRSIAGGQVIMGTFLGLAGSTTNETGVINIGLPVLAEVTDLTIFISVAANSASPSDKVELRNITLTGTPKPVIIDICLNINGIQAEVPDGYQINVSGECVVIPPTPIDICLNLAGLQETLPVGYEKNDLGQCIETPPIVDICPNISEVQLVVPEGMVVNSAGNCELASVPALDICPNLEGEQIILPTGYEINSFGHCIVIVTENPPPTPPAPKPKQCPKGFSKWIEKFNESHIWRADDVYRAVILVGGPTNRSSNRDRAHFLYIAGPTEVGDKYYRRFHKISQVCVKG